MSSPSTHPNRIARIESDVMSNPVIGKRTGSRPRGARHVQQRQVVIGRRMDIRPSRFRAPAPGNPRRVRRPHGRRRRRTPAPMAASGLAPAQAAIACRRLCMMLPLPISSTSSRSGCERAADLEVRGGGARVDAQLDDRAVRGGPEVDEHTPGPVIEPQSVRTEARPSPMASTTWRARADRRAPGTASRRAPAGTRRSRGSSPGARCR